MSIDKTELGGNEYKLLISVSKNENKLKEAIELLDKPIANVIKGLMDENKKMENEIKLSKADDKDGTKTDDKSKDDKSENEDPKKEDDGDTSETKKLLAELEEIKKEKKKLQEENKSLTEKTELEPKPDDKAEVNEEKNFFSKI